MKKVFYSFKYDDDSWRVQQIRNIGVVSNENVVEPNKWEEIKRKGDSQIKAWINENLRKADVLIVLVGANTYKSDWVKYEIDYAESIGKPIYSIFINNLHDQNQSTSSEGLDPVNSCHSFFKPSTWSSTSVYDQIKNYIQNI
jgi:hypothetical protein